MLTKNITRRVAIPHEFGQWIDLRLLSYRQFDEAAAAKVASAMKAMGAMPGNLMAQIAESREKMGQMDAAPVDPLAATYDKTTLLRLGIAGWSYDDPVTDETIDTLDSVTAEWAARTLLTLHERTADEKKDGSWPSTAPLTA